MVEQHERVERAERLVVKHSRQDDVLDVPDAVCLVNLAERVRVANGNRLLERDLLFQVLAMLCLRWSIRVVCITNTTPKWFSTNQVAVCIYIVPLYVNGEWLTDLRSQA